MAKINYIIIKKNRKNLKTKKNQNRKNSLMILNKEERKQARVVNQVYPYQLWLRKIQVNLGRVERMVQMIQLSLI